MKILLVNPPRFNGIPVIREERCEITERYSVLPPYSLLQIGGMLKGHELKLIDANGFDVKYENLDKKIKGENYDVLIFRFTPTTFDHDMKVVKISKKYHPKAKTVGICYTLGKLAKEVMKESNMDIYVKHEYESVIPNLIKNFDWLNKVEGIAYRKKRKIIVNKDAKSVENYEITPNYNLLPHLNPYFINTNAGKPFTIIYTSKGCPFNCLYCTVAGTKLKRRSSNSIINEIQLLKNKYGIRTISFFDETFTINRKRTLELCQELKKLNIKWYCNTRADLVDEELLMIMYKSGCRGLSLGVESGSEQILKNVRKGITVEQQEKAIMLAKKVGIKVYSSFIFGLPGENKETVKETFDFIKRTLPTSAQFNVAVPYPGTKLYDIARDRGTKGLNWRELYQHSSLTGTDDLSSKELEEIRKKAYKTLYFNHKWLIQNIIFVIKHPSDFILAFRYSMKIINNYFFKRMEHAH